MTDNTQPEAPLGGRWYMVTHDGAATLCIDQEDAQAEAAQADRNWPRMGPHRAVKLVEASEAGFTAADMATAEARGFRDGVASAAASAGSEPVAWQYQGRDGLWRDFIDARHHKNTVDSGEWPIRALYTHPSPPEGMVGGWMPIETAPKDGTAIDLWRVGGGREPCAASNGPAWAQGIGLIDAAMVMVDQPTEIRTIDNSDRDHEHRAARAQADSVLEDADRIVKWSDRVQRAHPKSEPEFWPDALRVKYMADEISDLRAARAAADSGAAPAAFQRALDIRTAQGWKLGGDKVPVLYTDTINGKQVCRDDLWLCTTAAFATPPAQAADSVLEDAARYRWLEDYLVGDRTDLDDEIVACKSVYDLSKVVDAARKQGGAT